MAKRFSFLGKAPSLLPKKGDAINIQDDMFGPMAMVVTEVDKPNGVVGLEPCPSSPAGASTRYITIRECEQVMRDQALLKPLVESANLRTRQEDAEAALEVKALMATPAGDSDDDDGLVNSFDSHTPAHSSSKGDISLDFSPGPMRGVVAQARPVRGRAQAKASGGSARLGSNSSGPSARLSTKRSVSPRISSNNPGDDSIDVSLAAPSRRAASPRRLATAPLPRALPPSPHAPRGGRYCCPVRG